MAERRLTALNDATESENRIHADDVAREYGFRGGLVPGVAVIAYAVPAVVADLGEEWLDGGRLGMRLDSPVYDGDAVVVRCERGEVTVGTSAGRAASGHASIGIGDLTVPDLDLRAAPSPRPPASAEALRPGTVLTTVRRDTSATSNHTYLTAIGDDPSWWDERDVLHPGWTLRDANYVLSTTVRLGPWIHVTSDIAVLARARPGEPIETRGEVVDEYERKGHHFVVLDAVSTAAGRPVMHVRHTAIWQPRRVTG